MCKGYLEYISKDIKVLNIQSLASHNSGPVGDILPKDAYQSLCGGKITTDEQLEILNCIASSSTTQEDKGALNDFYLNTTLVDPCTGEEIDKDGIMAQVCGGTSELTMAAVNDATLSELCSSCSAILIPNNETTSCDVVERYVPCSEVIFHKKGDRTFAQMEIDNYVFAACIPPPEDLESDDAIMSGLLRNVNLKVEIQIPAHLVGTSFRYGRAQTAAAQLLSAAMQYADDVIPFLNTCDNLNTIRYQYRNAFYSFLEDPNNKEAYFGSSNGILFKQNFHQAGIIPEKTPLSLFNSASDCD